MVDYKEFAQSVKAKYPQYANVDDRELAEKMIAKYPQYSDKVTFETKKGIDLTPSNVLRNIGAAPTALVKSIATGRDFPSVQKEIVERDKELSGGIGKFKDFLVDTSIYSRLPMANVAKGGGLGAQMANNALTGLGQGSLAGGLEGLKDDASLEGFAKGAVIGGATGAGVGAGVPATVALGTKAVKLLPMAGGKIAQTLGRVKPETLEQAVKPNSKALDLDEKTAQNLLMDTTERVQKDYQKMMDNAGREVQYAAIRLPENRGVWTSSLQDSLDDIYNSSQVSNNPNLNPAMQGNSDIYKKVNKWINSGEVPERLTASEMYDVMSNIKRNIPIDWEKPNAGIRNALKQQIYGDYARRLGNLSPELRKANANYAELAKFENNEGVRRILNPPKIGDIDSASTALRNYNSTVTKGNTNRNIQDLENLFVENGKQPFLNDIDDVNAAMDLLNIRGTGDSWLANAITQSTRPALKAVRGYNRFADKYGLDAIYEAIGREAPRYYVAPSAMVGQEVFK